MTHTADPQLNRFFAQNPLEKRSTIAQNLRVKYPDRIPVIIGRDNISQTPPITNYKFLAPSNVTIGKFIFEIRKNIPGINSTIALFFFLPGNILPPSFSLMGDLYERYKEVDGFLYLIYSCENTFGK